MKHWLCCVGTHLKPCLYALGMFFAVGLFNGETKRRSPHHRLVQRSHDLWQGMQNTASSAVSESNRERTQTGAHVLVRDTHTCAGLSCECLNRQQAIMGAPQVIGCKANLCLPWESTLGRLLVAQLGIKAKDNMCTCMCCTHNSTQALLVTQVQQSTAQNHPSCHQHCDTGRPNESRA